MDEAYVCRPQGDAFANADLPLHHTVKKFVRFPLVRLHDVKRVFFPDLKDRAWKKKLSNLGEEIHVSSDCAEG